MKLASVGKFCGSALVALGCTFFVVTAAVAQEGSGQTGGVDVQTFRPVAGPGGIFTAEGTQTAEHLQPYGSVFFDYFSNPLTLTFEDGSEEPVIDNRMGAHVLVGMGVLDRYQFEIGMPVIFVNGGEYFGESIEGGGPGDLNARAKATVLSSLDEVVGFGVKVDLTVPTGQSENYLGSRTVTATPGVIADSRFDTPAGEVLVASNLGLRIRGASTVHNLDVGSQLTYGLGGELEAVPDLLRVGLEMYGAVGFSGGAAASPLEMLLGAKFDAGRGVSITAGGGVGLVGGVGSPQWRGLAGVTYRPPQGQNEPAVTEPIVEEPVDEPEEVVEEVDERCPPEPEGFAGRYDEEGCAITPETFTGCDDLDPEWDGEVDEWGCPQVDSDGDGVVLIADACPLEPVVYFDGEISDGCPNDDVDGDDVPNREDHCPNTPGVSAHDGCPPPEDEERATWVDDEIEIKERVHFETDKAIIKPASYHLLEEVAYVLSEHPAILLVEVAGHSDARGDTDYNMMLSEERAKVVREFLIERGRVRAARVDAHGYGISEPLIDEDTEEAHAENRRVEFRVIETGQEE